ncbi:bile acid:sodium symporter family protein, partial [Endozoicomonas sp. SESOKO4]|uniref:bile acid:sodium symporter family protein n=1 Tax=Endozoicomonas sp. SESOKO4 TaxID=2828745 RepID=UPI0035A12135
ILAVALHNGTGLSLGYLVAHLSGFDRKTCKTVAIEVGMQNSGLAVVLATKFFTPAAALPATFFSIWHNITGSVLATWWARRLINKGVAKAPVRVDKAVMEMDRATSPFAR